MEIQSTSIFTHFVKGFDLYSQPINFSLNGQHKFKTIMGGAFSMIVVVLMIALSIQRINDIQNQNLYTVKQGANYVFKNMPTQEINLSEKKITWAFMISNYEKSQIYNDSFYGSFNIVQHQATQIIDSEITSDQQTEQSHSFNNIQIRNCNYPDDFSFLEEQYFRDYELSQYQCPSSQNSSIQGYENSMQYQSIHIQFLRCTGYNCSTDQDLEKWLENKWIYIYLVSQQFQEDAQENFIQSSFKDGNIFFTSEIKLDQRFFDYERQAYTFNQLLGELGGVYNSLLFIGFILYYQFRETMFFCQILSQGYLVGSQIEMTNHSVKTIDIKRHEIIKRFSASKIVNSGNNSNMQIDLNVKDDLKSQKPKLQRYSFDYIREMLFHRKYFIVSPLDIIKYTACKITGFFEQNRNMCNKYQQLKENYNRYQVGVRQVKSDLDLIQYINLMKEKDRKLLHGLVCGDQFQREKHPSEEIRKKLKTSKLEEMTKVQIFEQTSFPLAGCSSRNLFLYDSQIMDLSKRSS
ncbi:UNKNOWN [Stylonychia lemnae]|uniref:Transmembrane protein n=1 Tax=Stylonychia lemnae TaxID=5949 RepID=A0A077ZUD4_STYLE|nr:UNKNOWN [Stylonychia lemnae]|eukprot:CDW72081.1 UNKNOWN [Stylonychia lemnae]